MTEATDERYRLLDWVRQERPLYRDEPSASFVLSRMADARAWLSDASQWKDADRAVPEAGIRKFKPADMNRPGDRNSGIGWMDEPEHSRVRGPIQAALVRRVAGLRPAIESIVRERLETLPAGGFDALADYAAPIPVAVIGRLFGVDTSDFPRFRAWSEDTLNIFNANATAADRAAGKAAVEAISDFSMRP